MNQRQKDKKRKKKEVVKKERLAKKYAQLQKVREEEKQKQIAEMAGRPKVYTIRKPLTGEKLKQKQEEIKAKIERNLQIIEELEKEHAKEQEARKRINEKLEQEGHVTLEQKIKAINAAVQANQESQIQQSNDANCEKPN